MRDLIYDVGGGAIVLASIPFVLIDCRLGAGFADGLFSVLEWATGKP